MFRFAQWRTRLLMPLLLALGGFSGVARMTSAQQQESAQGIPQEPKCFAQMRVTDTWKKYEGRLTWGKGQCLAILDDGCNLSVPQWKVEMPWGKKVIAT